MTRRRRRGTLLAALGVALLAVTGCRSAPAPLPVPAEAPPPPAVPAPAPPAATVEPPLPAPTDPVVSGAPDAPAPPRRPARAAEGGDLLVRIGLAGDLERFELPCCAGAVRLSVDGRPVALPGPLVVSPAAGAVGAARLTLQAAALRDEGEARRLAGALGERTGLRSDVVFDAASGLYRVRLGRFADRAGAEAAQRRVATAGYGRPWVIDEGAEVASPAFQVTLGDAAGGSYRAAGRWLVVDAAPGELLAFDGVRYRGRLLLYLNDRGRLNVVNELPLEQYLRGVVPKELGPAQYPRIEALKAQAVAARTYTLRRLEEFVREGYDLCATPRCQVYGGYDAEHPLSDRAIAETAGEVLLHGDEVVEALYSATCGGHTEEVSVVFPWMRADYLQAVPCPEAGHRVVAGTAADGEPFPDALTRRLVPAAAEAATPADLERRLYAVARVAALPVPDDRLRSLERDEVLRFVRSLFDLALDPRLLLGAPPAPAAAPPGDETPGAPRRAADRGALPRHPPLDRHEAEHLIFRLGELLGLLEAEPVRHRTASPGRLHLVRDGGGALDLDLPSDLVTFVPGRRGPRVAGALHLAPGDRLTLYRWRGRPVAVAQEADPTAFPADRPARLQSWHRFRSDGELARQIGERFPGLGFRDLEVLERGRSGRVGRLRVVGSGGRSEVVEGLAVRWTLDLPDTRFELERARDGGEAGWRFTGGGWGHGVGLCQVGAYRMAGRSVGYRDILSHYYTGVRLGRVVPAAADGARSAAEAAGPAGLDEAEGSAAGEVAGRAAEGASR